MAQANQHNDEPDQENERKFLKCPKPTSHRNSKPPTRTDTRQLRQSNGQGCKKSQTDVKQSAAPLHQNQGTRDEKGDSEQNKPRPSWIDQERKPSHRSRSENRIEQRPNTNRD